jgi:hypothetical protein
MSISTPEFDIRMQPMPSEDSMQFHFPREGMMDELFSEKSNRDETEMARFGKKQQLKVRIIDLFVSTRILVMYRQR